MEAERARNLRPGDKVVFEVSSGRRPVERRRPDGTCFDDGVETKFERVEIVEVRTTDQLNNEAVVAQEPSGKKRYFGGGTRVKSDETTP